eukprot:1156219-Pelagomonas_calceolata.AAC.6
MATCLAYQLTPTKIGIQPTRAPAAERTHLVLCGVQDDRQHVCHQDVVAHDGGQQRQRQQHGHAVQVMRVAGHGQHLGHQVLLSPLRSKVLGNLLQRLGACFSDGRHLGIGRGGALAS